MISRDVTSTAHGWIKYKGKMHQQDLIVLASGELLYRDVDGLTRQYGSLHIIDVDEMALLLKDDPEVIVFGRGQQDVARLRPEAIDMLKRSSSKLIEGPTPEAIKVFDGLRCKKAALFHVTC